MNKPTFNAITLALCLAFSAGAMAQTMSKSDYKAEKDKIATNYKSAKTACDSLSGNASDICVAEAKGKDKVALAELEASYKPSQKNDYKVRLAKAEAVYAVANERCDDLAGNAKDVCVKEAKAVRTTGKADAKANMKVSAANTTANQKSADARIDASNKALDARTDAAADKTDANYAVAKEKCDSYAGSAKDACQDRAKARYGKN